MVTEYEALEGTLSVRGTATVSRTGVFNSVAIVGGYDASNATSEVTAGEETLIEDPASADETFGVSEIPRIAQVVSANEVGTIYGIPVPETENTESIASGTSLTLSETPVFNPVFHPDHEITVTDTDASADLETNIVYDETVSTPTEEDVANVNPITGDVEVDASGNYDVTYTYGDYSAAISTAGDLGVRNIIVGTEAPSVKSSLVSTLSDIANDFDFKRGFVNAHPEIDASEIGDYTPSQQNWRLVECAPAITTGAEGTVRGCAAIGGHMTGQPIGPDGSGLFESVGGISSLNTEYRPSEVSEFGGVSVLTRNGVVGKADTTSTDEQFRLIHAVEIIDQLALDLFDVCRDYAGGPQDIQDLETLLEVVCQNASTGNPPLLGFGDGRDESPYDVGTSLGADSGIADAGVTIVPYPIAEQVNLSLTVSDGFVQFEGAN